MQKLKADIKSNTPERLYLFYGEEAYLREHYLDVMRKLVVGDQMPEFNLIEFEGEIGADVLAEAIDSYPAMSDRKLVIVRDFDIFKVNEQYRTQLEKMLSDLPDYCCLIFVYANVNSKPDKRVKLYQTVSKFGHVVEFKRAGKGDLISWVKRRFAALNHEISNETAEYLLFYCGGLMQGLIPEIEKVGAYAKHKEITRGDIDEVAVPNPEAVVFDLTDAIANKQYEQAMAIAEKLEALNQEPISIAALIARQLRQLHTACLVLRRGQGAGELMRIWSMKSDYPAKLLLRTARQINIQWVEMGIKLCLEADAQLKLGGKNEVIQFLIARLNRDTGEEF